MNLNTKYFGTIDYEESDLIAFPQGLFGFPEEKSFLLIPFEGSAGTLLCLQSTVTPGLAFVVMDPFALDPAYAPELQPAELRDLGASEHQDLSYYVLCVVRDPVAESTVNLKCPVAIHPETRVAQQVILETSKYEMRHALAEFGTKAGEGLC